MVPESGKRKRKKKEEDHENLDRWLVSYADFITLLFTFFVMMYAVSAVNEGQYRTISHAIIATFLHRTPQEHLHVILSPVPNRSGLASPRPPVVLSKALELLQQKSPSSGEMSVIETSRSVRIRIQAGFLFREGHARIRREARPMLAKIARLLAANHRSIRVEGHTDNLPVHGRYRNNWALSGARAVNVLSYLLSSAPLDPRRTSTVAFGSSRPLVPNDTRDHRRQNRRVEIVILKKKEAQLKNSHFQFPYPEPKI